jgi:enoyl-CoA hydratase/carnithine racemase
MSCDIVVLEREESIAIIRFNRPDVLNALDSQMFLEITSAFDEIEKNLMTKVVILTGDKSFVAGKGIMEHGTSWGKDDESQSHQEIWRRNGF